jgi:deoxyribonuclease-4
VAAALNMAMRLHRPTAAILLENTAGEAGDVGYELAQVQEVISRLKDAAKIGVCYDTCHGFAAGYDIRTKKGVDALAREIDATVGLDRLQGIHLNDCLKDLGSRVDRHWHIGEGKIGDAGFRSFLEHKAFRTVPMIMETPKQSEEDDPRNLRKVRSLLVR